MRKYILAAAAAAAIASSPAAGQAGHFGVDGGILLPAQTHVDGKVTDGTGATVVQQSDLFGIKYKSGYDVDVVGGYDVSLFRLEGELGYKVIGLDRLAVDQATLDAISDYADVTVTPDDLQLDGHARVFSGMANGLLQAGGRGVSGFAGAGIGVANVKYSGGGLSASDTSIAWQLLAGVRTAISPELDFGLKYRYFRTGKLKFSETADLDGDIYKGTLSGHLSSHSILASFVHNFGRAAVTRPQPTFGPTSAPATQTCSDGSIILAANVCPTAAPAYAPPAAGAMATAPVGPSQVTIVPANTPSGRCIMAPDNYVGTGAANMPAVSSAMPLCSTVRPHP